MAKIRKEFETRGELLKFISSNTLPGANVSGLYVEYDSGEEKDEVQGCVGCALPSTPEVVVEEAVVVTPQEAYEAKFDKKVPNNKKNDVEWIMAKVEEK